MLSPRGETGLGDRVGRRVGEDVAVGLLGGVEVAVHEGVVRGEQARVVAALDLDAGGLEDRVDPLAQVGLGQHLVERVDGLPADDRNDERDALDVLVRAWCLSYEHQVGVGVSHTEYDLSPPQRGQFAPRAIWSDLRFDGSKRVSGAARNLNEIAGS